MKLGYVKETTTKSSQELVDAWGKKYGAEDEIETFQFRELTKADEEYNTGSLGTQEEVLEYKDKKRFYPYTFVEYDVSDVSDESDACRAEFRTVRRILAS